MKKHHCKRCKQPVEMHYDHVGDCDKPGACSGTFRHKISLVAHLSDLFGVKKLRRCDLAFENLTHDQVGKE
jgi:hypothetical protein